MPEKWGNAWTLYKVNLLVENDKKQRENEIEPNYASKLRIQNQKSHKIK